MPLIDIKKDDKTLLVKLNINGEPDWYSAVLFNFIKESRSGGFEYVSIKRYI